VREIDLQTDRKTQLVEITREVESALEGANGAAAALVDALEPFRKLSPFYHYVAGDPLRRGLDPWHTLFLVALAVVAAVIGVVLFARRDVAS